ncbi:hypothetical protein [Kitasatospora phosalacinea]|uniref:Uncharacterized protein n=1 Tax=Kitasatospora phosalacinea TaxID=2065 RepID=A0A9W6PJA5_9ACTN|nr:hypothetical protein [Kitasatospora phosalacinea]GLW56050.1 hypothetical protein Kpho01_40610 [Kitasatospora phosalacinea]
MRTPSYYLDLAGASQDPAVLHELAGSEYPFVRQAVAANPHARADALFALAARCRDVPAEHGPWNDNALLLLLAGHPAADRPALLVVLDAAAARLTAGARPYAAVLALAGRPELHPEELRALGRLPGASARLRSGLRRVLAARRP